MLAGDEEGSFVLVGTSGIDVLLAVGGIVSVASGCIGEGVSVGFLSMRVGDTAIGGSTGIPTTGVGDITTEVSVGSISEIAVRTGVAEGIGSLVFLRLVTNGKTAIIKNTSTKQIPVKITNGDDRREGLLVFPPCPEFEDCAASIVAYPVIKAAARAPNVSNIVFASGILYPPS
jgi:hypothetical protein